MAFFFDIGIRHLAEVIYQSIKLKNHTYFSQEIKFYKLPYATKQEVG